MGLDFVELVMEVEETFGFTIPDEDVAGLDTVGKLYDYIWENRFASRSPGCLSSVVFYRLRRALMSVTGVARSDWCASRRIVSVISNGLGIVGPSWFFPTDLGRVRSCYDRGPAGFNFNMTKVCRLVVGCRVGGRNGVRPRRTLLGRGEACSSITDSQAEGWGDLGSGGPALRCICSGGLHRGTAKHLDQLAEEWWVEVILHVRLHDP